MKQKSLNLAQVGERALKYIESNGTHVEWKHPFIIQVSDKQKRILKLSREQSSLELWFSWESKPYADTASGKKRAIREFIKYVLARPEGIDWSQGACQALGIVADAQTLEELDFKLSVYGV